ncbi:hypothetical protein Tco_1318008 [Tanacetum coccineum]
MANVLEDIQCTRSDTRPPMLDRTDFISWQQRIRLYCRGKENRINILKLIDEGPFQMGMMRETLATEDKGEPIYEYYVRFAKLINDMRNIKMTMSRMQLNSKFVNNMLPEWGRFVMAVKLNIVLKESNYDQLLTIHSELHQIPGTTPQFKKAWLWFRTFRVDRTEVRGTMQGEYVRLVMGEFRTEENGVVLDEEQLIFLAGGQDNVVDEDVDEPPVQDLALNVDNVFQADDYEAFDSEMDEAPTA